MIYEIFTYGGGDYIVEVLNAIVRVMGANSFTTALRIFLLFGLFSVLFDIAINGNFTKGVKYYISFLLIYNVLFVPKVDVLVIDPINQIEGNRKVDDIPFGLAFTAHTISSLGSWMADVFGMNFVLPNDLQYNKNGILFGSTLIQDTFNARLSNSKTQSNFNNYIRQCIIPSVMLKKKDNTEFINSNSIQDLLDVGKNGVLAYDFIDDTGNKKINLCSDNIEIAKDINIEINKLMLQQESIFNKNNNANITDINQYILGVQESTTKIFEQSLIANAISDATQEYLSNSEANAGAINYALTKDNIQKKTNGVLQWIQAGKFLPLLKIVIESMFYGLFPIVILLAMLPNGIKIFKNYVLILLALQVWSPLYAILNLIMTLEQKYKISGIISQTGNIISLYNKQAIIDVTQGIQIQAGLLAFLIPPLSFKVVQGLQNFGENMASGIASSGSFASSQVISEVASGSLSYGNTAFKNTNYGNESFDNKSYNNTSANKYDTDVVKNYGKSFETGGDGITHAKYSDGLETTNINKRISSNLGTNFTTNENQLVASQTALKNAKSTTESYANAYIKSIQDLQQFSFADSQVNGKVHSLSNSDSIKGNVGVSGKIGTSGNNIHASIDYDKIVSWADSNNISVEDRKTLTDLISQTKQLQTSYNQAYNEQNSKERNLNYALNTSVSSTLNANNEVERHLREDLGWDQEKIDYTAKNNPKEIELIGRRHLSSQVFNTNKPQTLEKINSSTEIAKNSYNNQNNIIDSQYAYNKNELKKDNSLKMFQNTDPTNWTDFSTSKKKNN